MVNLDLEAKDALVAYKNCFYQDLDTSEDEEDIPKEDKETDSNMPSEQEEAGPLSPSEVPEPEITLESYYGHLLQKDTNILFKITNKSAKLPKQASEGSVGYDLYAINPTIIPPKTQLLISTGLGCEFPTGYYGQLASQSGFTSKFQIYTLPGVINNDYRVEIKILIKNDQNNPFTILLDRPISQLLIIPYAKFHPKLVDTLSESSRGTRGFGSTNEPTVSLGVKGEIIQLTKSSGCPPGTHFLGATPCQALVRLMSLTGTKSSVIIDSGSNILLISSQLISQIQPPLKIKTGQKFKISQVTGWSSTDKYVNIDLYFDTEEGPVRLDLEAYVVKDMNAPIILGNEFADQYSLSIIQNEGTSLKLGTSGRSLSLSNLVESSYLDVKAYNLLAYKQQHNRSR